MTSRPESSTSSTWPYRPIRRRSGRGSEPATHPAIHAHPHGVGRLFVRRGVTQLTENGDVPTASSPRPRHRSRAGTDHGDGVRDRLRIDGCLGSSGQGSRPTRVGGNAAGGNSQSCGSCRPASGTLVSHQGPPGDPRKCRMSGLGRGPRAVAGPPDAPAWATASTTVRSSGSSAATLRGSMTRSGPRRPRTGPDSRGGQTPRHPIRG